MSRLQEIRWHGRGGQGAWTASELLAKAAIIEGKNVQSFPEFGPERMGAPLAAYTRISSKPIRLHCSVYTPNLAVVLDPTLMKTVKVAYGLTNDGTLVVNIFTPVGSGTGANLTIAERIKDLFDRAKFSSIIFDPASGPAQIVPASPEPYYQTQLTATFEAYLD